MNEITPYLSGIFAISCQIFGIWLYIRAQKVYKFRMFVKDLCFNYNKEMIISSTLASHFDLQKDSAFVLIYDKMPSFYKMVFSMKKLKLQSYLTKEQIQRLYFL